MSSDELKEGIVRGNKGIQGSKPQNNRSIRMHFNETNVVGVTLPFFYFLHCVIVVYSKVHIISGGDDPLLSDNKLCTSDGDFAQLKTFYKCLKILLR
jgi:hypothetical protein